MSWALISHLPACLAPDLGLCRLVDPGVPIPPQAQAVHGITDDQVREHGTRPRLTLGMIDSDLADAARPGVAVPIVAYNAVYDLTQFERECTRHHGAGHRARTARGCT